ncbi:hypothetical protein MNBD_NITROSPINAE03-334 [hydrothermal vent metagenome]|uniref:DUF1638 domain-containing protein n=1 Tax=hydrothermal vent metagenome TaxID=652676 RepID=A0A3B1C706_9ZZZZ
MRIGVVACKIMKLELDKVLSKLDGVTELVYLEEGKHVYPDKLKISVLEEINAIKDKVDVIFLGYGHCQSLKGIEDQFDIPIVHPDAEDCIGILLTPERYAHEITKEAGTWFMTPGWAEAGADMILKALHLDKFDNKEVDTKELTDELFAGYTRGLFIDTGVGNDEYFIDKAKQSCEMFDVRLEKTVSSSTILEDSLAKCREIAGGLTEGQLNDNSIQGVQRKREL